MMDHNVRDESLLSYDLRIGTLDDVPAMAELAAKNGDDARLIAVMCERILKERFGFGIAVYGRSERPDRLVGFMNIPLLRPRLGNRIRKEGVPFSHILATEDERFVANEAEVARGNGDSGHDLFITHFYQDPDLSPKAAERTLGLMVSGFVDRFMGNQVRALLFEAKGMEGAKAIEPGGYRIIETYDDWHRKDGSSEAQRPILLQSDRAYAVANHNFYLARLLDYQAPVLRFPPAALEVLRCAYLGYTDARMVDALCLNVASLNSRWTRILDIAEANMPSLFDQGTRNRSRDRQPLLNYLRNHPEEMWPYEPVQS